MDPELETQKTYNHIAERWAEEHNSQEYWREEFELFHQLLPRGNILDVGCGPSTYHPLFQEKGYGYTGVDYAERLVAVARSRFPHASFVVGNMYDLPFACEEFDGFWAVASLLHIPKHKIGDVLARIRGVVKKGGVGAIMLKKGMGEQMAADDNRNGDEGDRRFFAYWQREEFIKPLEQAGFEVVNFLEREKSEGTTWITFFVRFPE